MRQPAAAAAQHHLQRPAEAAVPDAEGQQGVAPGGPHGPEVAQRPARPPAQLEGQDGVGHPGVARPGRGDGRAAGSQHQVGPAGQHRAGHRREVAGIERAVAVHEADDAVGRVGRRRGPAQQADPKPGPALGDDTGARRPGDVARTVGGAVVDHDRPVPGRHGVKEGRESRRFVEDGDDHVGHGSFVSDARLRGAAEVLTIR